MPLKAPSDVQAGLAGGVVDIPLKLSVAESRESERTGDTEEEDTEEVSERENLWCPNLYSVAFVWEETGDF